MLRKFLSGAFTGFLTAMVVVLLLSSFLLNSIHIVRVNEAATEAYVVAIREVSAVQELPPDYAECTRLNWCHRLAQALVYEARGEGAVGMRAVAYVILERVASKGWPDTIKEVIHQKKQFSFLGDMHKQSTPTKEDFDIAYREAYDAYFGRSENPAPDAKWYHSTGIKAPRWTKELVVVTTLGGHIFYKEK